MSKSALPFIFTLALITLSTTALAQPVVLIRCPTDSLNAAAALQRIEWARRCALTTNTGGPNSSFPSTMALDTTFNPAQDYREIDPDHAYSGIDRDYNINFTYGFCRYRNTPVYTVFQETSGSTAGFWKWSYTFQLPRLIYPTFETMPVFGDGMTLFPLPNQPNDCGLYYRDPSTGLPTRWTGNFYVVGYCTS